jgi:hypothetical protein
MKVLQKQMVQELYEHPVFPSSSPRVYYRRVGVDLERDFQQRTLEKLGNIGLYVIRINRKYFWTTYEVKVQVFNDMCEEPDCDGPISDPVIIYSAEDMPQVAPTKVGARPHNSTAINITWNELPDVREKVSEGKFKPMAGKCMIGYVMMLVFASWTRQLHTCI